MNVRELLLENLCEARQISRRLLDGLSDAELRMRPAPGTNTIAWQLGHLVVSERAMLAPANVIFPDLPAGFAARHAKAAAGRDDKTGLLSHSAYLALLEETRSATLAAVGRFSAEDLNRETGIPYAPTTAAVLRALVHHELMHAGQWTIVRRLAGLPPAL
jgi:uncharacterized damage-inducible protein DinB